MEQAMSAEQKTQTWLLDQLAKSEFFHQKVHLWGLLTVADALEGVRGDELEWNMDALGITPAAWNRVIHQGIKPIRVFAHPQILTKIPRAVGYCRMLAMVSQKSMNGVGLSVVKYESGPMVPSEDIAQKIASHLNAIISRLIEADSTLDEREFDLWRGMSAGAQAQGSWVNAKGEEVQKTVSGLVQRRLVDRGLVSQLPAAWAEVTLADGRRIVFGDDPDIAVYRSGRVRTAVEIKGGIDPAGVLERLGAALKSLARIREEQPTAVTVLIMHKSALTATATQDLEINRAVVTNWLTIEDILTDQKTREELFDLLEI
jgi:hypothetical protein